MNFTENVTDVVILTEGTITASPNGVAANIVLSLDDLNEILRRANLGTSSDNTFISVSDGVVLDFFNNNATGINDSVALSVSIMNDTTGAILTEFSLDLNTGVLNLTFTETIDSNTFTAGGVQLLSSPSRGAVTYTLSDGSLTEDDYTVSLQLSTSDLNNIKLLDEIGNTENDTYILLQPFTVLDTSGNELLQVPISSAIRASVIVQDATNPELTSFTLDLDTGILQLLFSEVVLVASLDLTQFTLLDSRLPAANIPLTSMMLNITDSDVIDVMLSDSDLNMIKANPFIGTDENSTYLTITTMAVTDFSRNPVIAINVSSALQASNVTADITPPSLTNYTLDLGMATLTLTFSEIVNASTINVSQIIIQDSPTTPNVSYSLQTSMSA